jgi:CHAD domain-containing protein
LDGYPFDGGKVQNRLQEGYRTMNSGILPIGGEQAAASEPNWSKRLEAWRRLLAACVRKPSRKRVHSLRVATLRIEAELEDALRGHAQNSPAVRAAKRWNRQAGKLRRALSAVRETDVHLARLVHLRGTLGDQELDSSRMRRIYLRQIGGLEGRLTQQRKTAGKEFSVEAGDRRARLERCSRELEAAFAREAPQVAASEPRDVRVLIEELAKKFPELDREHLHEFRKRVKMVRYLAENFAAADPTVARRIAALRRMQAAAGEWHDLQALAKEAGRKLRGREKKAGLAELLETLAEESLERALETCRRTLRLLVQHGAPNGPFRVPLLSKLPVRRAEPVTPADERKLA